jgi:vacuolar iron transporter family protein
MGLGAYLAALTDRKHYDVELERERRQILHSADQEDQEMYKLFAEYGLGKEVVSPLARQLRGDPDAWVKVRVHSPIKRFVLFLRDMWSYNAETKLICQVYDGL